MTETKMGAYLTANTSGLSEGQVEVREALALIAAKVKGAADPLPLQLLALRRYLRIGGEDVHARWAWSAEEATSKVIKSKLGRAAVSIE